MSDDANKFLNPWHPMTDMVDKKTIGKLLEELGECVAAASRCLIQGIDEREPVTDVVNREWLENEIADCFAGFKLCEERFKLDTARMNSRMMAKYNRLKEWHRMA